MTPWIRNLLFGGGGTVLPSTGLTFLTSRSSLILDEGTGGPTWSRATEAWRFNDQGYLWKIPSGCAEFGGARLVRNLVKSNSENVVFTAAGSTPPTVTNGVTYLDQICSQIDIPITAGGYSVTRAVANSSNADMVLGRGYSAQYSVALSRPLVGAETIFLYFLTASKGVSQATIDSSSPSLSAFTTILGVPGDTPTATIGAVCNVQTASTFASAVTIYITKLQVVEVTGYDASYVPEYVSVGVDSAPFPAGIDGAKYFETDWQGAPIAAANLLGFRREAAATNNLLHSRDLSNAAWSTKTNITAAKTATGLDGIANTATTLTATAADAIILQPITLASEARCASAYVKRRTGTGTIYFTQDGTNWTDITSLINSSTWSRVEITSTLANPSVGFKLGTSGDAIDVDVVQNEAGAVATSPIVTTTTTITRNADSLTYQTAGNIDFAVGTMFVTQQSNIGAAARNSISIGSSYFGISASATTSYRVYDETTVVTASGLSDITTAPRKRAASWGPAGLKVNGDGVAPTSGAFDGSFGSGATISVGLNANGYTGPVAIYNYQMTDAELQALTA